MTFTIYWDNTVVSREQMQAIINDAGRFVGIGDGRNIGFGRFRVPEFEVVEGQDRALVGSSPKSVRKSASKRAKAASAH